MHKCINSQTSSSYSQRNNDKQRSLYVADFVLFYTSLTVTVTVTDRAGGNGQLQMQTDVIICAMLYATAIRQLRTLIKMRHLLRVALRCGGVVMHSVFTLSQRQPCSRPRVIITQRQAGRQGVRGIIRGNDPMRSSMTMLTLSLMLAYCHHLARCATL